MYINILLDTVLASLVQTKSYKHR